MVFSGAALPAPYSILEVGPPGPAGGAAEGPELGYGAPGATYGSKNGPSQDGNIHTNGLVLYRISLCILQS